MKWVAIHSGPHVRPNCSIQISSVLLYFENNSNIQIQHQRPKSHNQAVATYAQVGVCSNYLALPAIVYFLANFNFYNNMEFNPSFTHSKLYKYTV